MEHVQPAIGDPLTSSVPWEPFQQPTEERVVRHGKIVTAAGISSGIDMALQLVAWELGDDMGKAVQLILEYDPQPPFDAGSPKKAPAPLVEELRGMLQKLSKQEPHL